MRSFPFAAVTNHKYSGLQQHKFIFLLFWRSEVRNVFHWATPRCWQGCTSPKDCRGESISLPLPASGGRLYFLACDPFVHLQSQQCSISVSFNALTLSFCHHMSFFLPLLLLSHCLLGLWPSCSLLKRAPCDYSGSTWIIQDTPPTARPLI